MAEYTSYLAGAIFLGVVTVLLAKLVESFKSFSRRRALYKKFPQNPTNFIFGILLEVNHLHIFMFHYPSIYRPFPTALCVLGIRC